MVGVFKAELKPLCEKPQNAEETKEEGEENGTRTGNGCKTPAAATAEGGTGDATPDIHAINHRLQSDKARAAASVFAWLRRPLAPIEPPTSVRSKVPKTIENVSKIMFPVLFGIFTLGFFLAFAVIKPSQDENWKLSSFVSPLG